VAEAGVPASLGQGARGCLLEWLHHLEERTRERERERERGRERGLCVEVWIFESACRCRADSRHRFHCVRDGALHRRWCDVERDFMGGLSHVQSLLRSFEGYDPGDEAKAAIAPFVHHKGCKDFSKQSPAREKIIHRNDAKTRGTQQRTHRIPGLHSYLQYKFLCRPSRPSLAPMPRGSRSSSAGRPSPTPAPNPNGPDPRDQPNIDILERKIPRHPLYPPHPPCGGV